MDQIVFHNKIVEVIDRDGYTVLRSPRPGRVAVLPFRILEQRTEFLFRLEPIVSRQYRVEMCSLTGTLEKGETPEKGALRELYEESGFWIGPERLLPLGYIHETKASESPLRLYAADVTGLEAGVAPGDGTKIEKASSTEWVSDENLPQVQKNILDGVLLALICRWKMTFSHAAG